jgi:hypothetical protein
LITNEPHVPSHRRAHTGAVSTTAGTPQHGQEPHPVQEGVELPEFPAQYGTEEQSAEALFGWRWPRGFVCPHCGIPRASSSCARAT